MPFDAAVQTFLDSAPELPPDLSVVEQRRFLRLLIDLNFLRYAAPGPELPVVTDHRVNDDVRVRVYRPAAGRLPVHLSLHGGGWWTGSIDEDVVDAIHRTRCRDSHCVVVAIEYRLAPEHRFPAPVDDAFATLAWVHENADELGIDPARVSIGGSSAGANIAAATALRARDEWDGPPLVFQLLEVPALDLTCATFLAELDTPDLRDLRLENLPAAVAVYLNAADEALSPFASPLLAPDLTGLPPAHVMTAQYDGLRAEGEEYGRRLLAAGVPAVVRRYDGALHGSAMLTRTWAPAAEWQRDAGAALRAAQWKNDVPPEENR
ncbi:alpha/beta hydrolase [Lentzea sp. NPDC058436]|uniref:alpha/beta hydrolase n=1 Tax=Lentzea sp. NPDC058436 TaxID=3346499 RepID=UPI0036522CEF